MSNPVKILNVRLPPEIIKGLDSLVEREIYGSRSEAIRDMLRETIGGKK